MATVRPHHDAPPLDPVQWTEGWWYGLPVFRWFHGERARRRLRNEAWCLAPVAAALVPVSTSAAEIAFGLCALLWYLGGVRDRGRSVLWSTPVGAACLVFFAWLALSTLWSDAPLAHEMRLLVKYRSLLYIAILLSLFEDGRLRRLTSNAFVAAMLVTLAASWLMRFDLLHSKWGNVENCAYFKNHIAQNVMMAFTAFLLARSAAAHRPWRWLKVGLAILCLHNVLFMVDGRTGYVIVAVLVPYFTFSQAGLRGFLVGAATLAVAAVGVFQVSDGFRERIELAVVEARGYFDGQRPDHTNSIGQRLQFVETSLAVGARRPVFGHGTGSFEEAYRREAERRGVPPTRNPHSQLLMSFVQTGAVGVLMLLGLFGVQWFSAGRLPKGRRDVARALVLAIAVGCVFNSFLIDKTESSFFALFSAICFAPVVSGDELTNEGESEPAESSAA